MEMTLDNAIVEMEKELIYFLEQTDMKYPESIKYERDNNPDFDRIYFANTMAIEVMHKYQKIEEILKDIPHGGDTTISRIQKVIEGRDIEEMPVYP